MTGTRQIKQDTIVHRPSAKNHEVPVKRLLQEQADNSHYFSDEFQPLLNTQGAVKYVREDVSHFELKKLRRGIIRRSCFSICMVDADAGETGAGGVDCRLSS
jgi:DNA-nicking Smr family endonuclease